MISFQTTGLLTDPGQLIEYEYTSSYGVIVTKTSFFTGLAVSNSALVVDSAVLTSSTFYGVMIWQISE